MINGNYKKFINNTIYKRPVDIKKLEYIYKSIKNYLDVSQKNIKDINILEVGCGPGGITFPLASLGCNVVAFDMLEESVNNLNKKIKEKKILNLKVTVDNGYDFNFEEKFDIIIASEVFEHVLEPSTLATNISKHMSVGSYLIITTPNGYGPWEMKNYLNPLNHLKKISFIRRQFGRSPYVFGSGIDHCQFYTRKRLIKIFSKLSLNLLSCTSSDSLLTFLPWITKNSLISKIDIKLADILPHSLASGWYFTFKLHKVNDS